jgi:hypothetical protein
MIQLVLSYYFVGNLLLKEAESDLISQMQSARLRQVFIIAKKIKKFNK